ncbi:MAG: hypothetical protein ACJ76Y_23870 [Thermoanaerobaculia bacterium]
MNFSEVQQSVQQAWDFTWPPVVLLAIMIGLVRFLAPIRPGNRGDLLYGRVYLCAGPVAVRQRDAAITLWINKKSCIDAAGQPVTLTPAQKAQWDQEVI